LCVLLLLQVTVIFTVGEKGKRRRSQARSTRFQTFLAEAREPTCHQWRWRAEETRRHCFGGAEGLSCNSRLFWGYFVILNFCDVLFYFKFLLFVIIYGCMRKKHNKKGCVRVSTFFMYVIELKNQKDKKNEFNVLICI